MIWLLAQAADQAAKDAKEFDLLSALVLLYFLWLFFGDHSKPKGGPNARS